MHKEVAVGNKAVDDGNMCEKNSGIHEYTNNIEQIRILCRPFMSIGARWLKKLLKCPV